MRSFRVFVALVLLVPSVALGADKLKVGEPAPGLSIEAWVKGEEATIAKKNTYVIMFFSSDCDKCRKSFPILSEIQSEHEDDGLIVVGISADKVDAAQRFVDAQATNIGFRVAVDRRGSTKRAWSVDGKADPGTAFIVDQKSKVQYIGPVNKEFGTVLRSVVGGRYDAKLFDQVEPMIKAAKRARRERNFRVAFKMLDDVIKTDPEVFALQTLERFEIQLVDVKDEAGAYQYARTLLEDYQDDPRLLAALAMMITTSPEIPDDRRDLDVAMAAAEAAAKAADPSQPYRYSIQALVHYHAGRIDKAVRFQRKAYFVARPNRKGWYKRVLREYQAAADRVSGTARKRGR